MTIVNKNDIEEIEDLEYRCKVYKILNSLLLNDDLIHRIIVSVDETELTNETMVTIEFCLTSNSPPWSLKDEGYYISFYHKEKSFWEKYLLREKEYYKYTYYIEREQKEK